MEVDFFTPNVAFFVCVNLSRYMKIGENLLNEVPVEKSILVDFDQFITLVNKWKAKWVHEGYSWFKKGLPPSDVLFLLRGQLQGSVRVRSMKVSTNQWHNYGSKSCLDLIELNAQTVKRQKEEVEEFQKREKRGQ